MLARLHSYITEYQKNWDSFILPLSYAYNA